MASQQQYRKTIPVVDAALRDAGTNSVITARDVNEALRLIAEGAPDVINLDLKLADSDEGFGLAAIALQSFNPAPEILFLEARPG